MMVLFVLAYLGGVLTIVSPCILPVIPFVLARADRPFLKNGLPMLVGMALAFAVVATLASVAGGWVVSANQYGRMAALTLLAIFGVATVFVYCDLRPDVAELKGQVTGWRRNVFDRIAGDYVGTPEQVASDH